jgi:CDP-diacylglycerol--serine O-phosphatidyltransferase
VKPKWSRHLPNILTFCNMAIGLGVICMMIHNHTVIGLRLACHLIFIAVILDCLDGMLARHLNVCTEMGRQLDSFADFISFGVAPIVVFVTSVPSVSPMLIIVLLLYPLAGVYRLVRHNLQRQCEYFTGLPITIAGFLLAAALLVRSSVYSEFSRAFTVFFLVLTTALAALMVSTFRINRVFCKRICGEPTLQELT